MRAAVIEAPYELVVKEVAPPACGEDEILIRVHRAAICNQSDWEVYAGTSSIIEYIGGYPHILGHEQSGEVVEVGPQVEVFEVGDRVTAYWRATGAFGEYNTLNPNELAVIKLDNRVSYDEGAIMEMAGGGAMRNVYGSQMRPTDTVAVIGVGPAGLLTGMVAGLFHARAWIAIDVVDFRLQKALELGAAAAYNVADLGVAQLAGRVHEQFPEIDMVFETMGVDRTPAHSGLQMAVDLVKTGGDVRLFTFAPMRHPLPIGDALMKSVNFIGRKVSIDKTRDLLNLAHQWVAEGRYPVESLITHHLPLDAAEEGLRLAHEHPQEAIKVVLDIA